MQNNEVANGTNGWPAWGKHVLKELERLNATADHHDKRLAHIEQHMAVMESKLMMCAPKIESTDDKIKEIETDVRLMADRLDNVTKKVEIKPKAVITGTLPPSILTFLWFLGKSNGWW